MSDFYHTAELYLLITLKFLLYFTIIQTIFHIQTYTTPI